MGKNYPGWGNILIPHTYVQDVKKTIDALPRNAGLILEEELILLSIATDYIMGVTKKLMDLAARKVWSSSLKMA